MNFLHSFKKKLIYIDIYIIYILNFIKTYPKTNIYIHIYIYIYIYIYIWRAKGGGRGGVAVMPCKVNKIIEFSQYRKSDGELSIIYADLKSLIV